MNLLLDTCTFLWLSAEPDRLSADARSVIEDSRHNAFVSVASAWEISLKYANGKLNLPKPPDLYVPLLRARHGIESLEILEAAALHVHRLPRFHSDPFDRILVSQATVHDLVIVSPDRAISQYPVRTLW